MFAEAAPDADGIRRLLRRVPTLSEQMRAEVLCLVNVGPAIFLAIAENPPSILLAASPALSKDGSIHCGDLLKRALAEAGGGGGGNSTLAQGSLPNRDSLDEVARALASQLGFST
jgi:alanyl-tRNA synthetase